MKSIILICPFFGTLPKEYFQLILNSCENNPSIDWLLITDDRTNYKYPQNVKVVYNTWEEFSAYVREKVKIKLNLNCVLNKPYKLCDYRPAFGLIFDQYLKDYDYWGNTDFTDVLYGNLRYFLPKKVLTFDKINFLGHLTLYKNTDEVNNRCRLTLPNGNDIKKILSSSDNFAFDEAGENGIQQIYNKYNFSFIYVDNIEADISPMRYSFQLSKFDSSFHQYYEKPYSRIFSYNNGKLSSFYVKNKEVITEEYGGIHFQKRKMHSELGNKSTNKFLIVPYGFIKYNNNIDKELIVKYSPNKIYLPFFRLKWKALKVKSRKVLRIFRSKNYGY